MKLLKSINDSIFFSLVDISDIFCGVLLIIISIFEFLFILTNTLLVSWVEKEEYDKSILFSSFPALLSSEMIFIFTFLPF